MAELCFHTAMTGYQEVMTDPSFARQAICFTFPHIGNVGANDEDVEADDPHAVGAIVREPVTVRAISASEVDFPDWMKRHGRIGLAGVDTRALTKLVRREGPPTVVIAHSADGRVRRAGAGRDGEGLAGAGGHGPGEGSGRASSSGVERRQVGDRARLCRRR